VVMDSGGEGVAKAAGVRDGWAMERWGRRLWKAAGWIGTAFLIVIYTKSMWIDLPRTRGLQDAAARMIFTETAFVPALDTPLQDKSLVFGQFCIINLGQGEFALVTLKKSGGGQKDIKWRAVGTGQTQCIAMPAGEYKLSGRIGGAWFGEGLGFGWGGRSFQLDEELWFHGSETHYADLIAVI